MIETISNATFWAAATAVVTAIYTFYTGRMVKNELKPKLYLIGDIRDKGRHPYDKGIMGDIGLMEDHMEKGFSNIPSQKMWVLKVVNNSPYPATNIKIKYSIKLYKNQLLDETPDRVDYDYKTIHFKTVDRILKIDYLPPTTENEYTIMFMDKFPSADLKIKSFKSKERIYMRNLTISKYEHEGFNKIEDPKDLLMLLGYYRS